MAHGKTLELRRIKKAPPEVLCICGDPYDGPKHYTKLGLPRVRGACKQHLRAGFQGIAGVGKGPAPTFVSPAPLRRSPRVSVADCSFHTREVVRGYDLGEFYTRRVSRKVFVDAQRREQVTYVPGPRL